MVRLIISGPGSSPSCVVFLGKTLYSHSGLSTPRCTWVLANLKTMIGKKQP